jgi:type IV secretion system protein VirD4
LLGQETVLFQTMAGAIDSDKTGISYSQQHTGRLLLTPDEVRNLPAKGQLLFLAGQRPIFAEKLAYFSDPEFTGMFDPV